LEKKQIWGTGIKLKIGAESRLILVGQNYISDCVFIEPLVEIKIGFGSSVQAGCRLVGNIEIGEGVLIAPNVLISSGSHIFSQRSSDFIKFQDEDFCIDKPVFIGSDCWIGYNVTILPGVVVGKGSIVGANSLVRNDIPPYSIAGGIPARVLKPRLDFLPPSKLSARNINDLPYWSNGLRTFVKNVECFALQEQSFSFYLSKENPKNLFLKFKAPGGGVFSIQIIINGQAQSKVTSRDTFKIDLDVKNSSIYLVEARVFDLKVSEVELGIEEVWIV
jgi:acetyltransferase-like isoleucine patch superfamily enzyme